MSGAPFSALDQIAEALTADELAALIDMQAAAAADQTAVASGRTACPA